MKIPVEQAGMAQLAGLGALGSLGWAGPSLPVQAVAGGLTVFLNDS